MPWAPLVAGGLAAAGAIGGAAIQSGAAGRASRRTEAAAREALRMQQGGADRSREFLNNSSMEARDFLRQFYGDAAGFLQQGAEGFDNELRPIQAIGLDNLHRLSEFTDPDSAYSNAERASFDRRIGANRRARGLTGSGTEIAGLTDFELGLGRDRRSLGLNLANLGASTSQLIAQNQLGLGQGLASNATGLGTNLANIASNRGSQLAQIYSNLGREGANTLTNSANTQAQLGLAGGQAASQGLIGLANAGQVTLAGLGQNQQAAANQAYQQQLLQGLFPTSGSGGGGVSFGGGGNFNLGNFASTIR